MRPTSAFRPIKRAVNQELFYYILGDYYHDTAGTVTDNDTFMMRDYNFSEDADEGVNMYHFHHKPSGLMIRWYKYPLRSPDANMEISHEEWRAVLYDCLNAIRGIVVYPIERWWEHGGK